MRCSINHALGCSDRVTRLLACPQSFQSTSTQSRFSHSSEGLQRLLQRAHRCSSGQHSSQRASVPCRAVPAAVMVSVPAAVTSAVAGSLGPECLAISIAAATAYTAACFALVSSHFHIACVVTLLTCKEALYVCSKKFGTTRSRPKCNSGLNP